MPIKSYRLRRMRMIIDALEKVRRRIVDSDDFSGKTCIHIDRAIWILEQEHALLKETRS